MYIYLKYGNTNNGDLTMNRKIIVMIIILLLSLIVGVIIYKNITKKENIVGLNETTQNIMEISLKEEGEEVTDECLNEWNDYNEYMGERIEEANSNVSEQDTHYLIKDVYGHIEVYYLDEKDNEYLYKKTDISTDYLTEEDKDDLQVGIEVVGIEELNKMLEDFE